jgi:predicted dehydrogenase
VRCDLDPELRARALPRYPGVHATGDFDDVLADPEVSAVAVAVDTPGHHRLARQALAAGRHVFVEKPLALASADGEELCALADRRGLVLMVGHLLLYHPAVEHAKAAIDRGELGELYYLHAERVNLGIVRETESAWWSLAAHDIALAIHLFDESPASVSASGASFLRRARGIEDIASASLRFGDGRIATIQVSWLAPEKRRRVTMVGSRQMLTFDDGAPRGKLVLHGHSAEGTALRRGAITTPVLPDVEPLLVECEHFVSCVASGARPRSDGRQGVAVVRVLEAGERSMRQGGVPVTVDPELAAPAKVKKKVTAGGGGDGR